MNSGQIENQILDAIQTVVDSAVAKAGYDKTISATIVKCSNEAMGKYVIRYQDGLFNAYSQDPSITYSKGTEVYVLIPRNDTSATKTILGTVDKLGSDFIESTEGDSLYDYVGNNVISSTQKIELCTYNPNQIVYLYDKTGTHPVSEDIQLNIVGAELYLKRSQYLTIGAYFQTAIPIEQRIEGNYGLIYKLTFGDNATGADIQRTYRLDINNMLGDPYDLAVPTRQFAVFDIDAENFKSIDEIYLFQENFPKTEAGHRTDIFINNFELCGANPLERDIVSDCSLSVITPQGIYFDDNDAATATRSLEAQVRLKGSVIRPTSETLKYYWFRENNAIVYTSPAFQRYGGQGWECLNDFTEPLEGVRAWIPATYNFITKKSQNPAKENRYKCVAVYNNDIILTKEITILNISSSYTVEIESTGGNTFHLDAGSTTLHCKVTGGSSSTVFTYSWSMLDAYNNFISLPDTSDSIFVEARSINQYATYKCIVSVGSNVVGRASITLYNILEAALAYSVNVENGNQVFKYNTAGISPACKAVLNPIDVLPLSLQVYDDNGMLVADSAILTQNITWKVPKEKSLIYIPSAYTPTSSDEEYDYYQGYRELNFNIADKYNMRAIYNDIQVIVEYQGKRLLGKTDLTFVKEGELGTNGTEFTCKLIPNINAGYIQPENLIYTYNEDTGAGSFNIIPAAARTPLKVEFYHNENLIYTGTQSGETTDEEPIDIKWSVLKNIYNATYMDSSNFTIDENNGQITASHNQLDNPANIIKAEITYGGNTYYSTYPIIFARVKNTYAVELKEYSGFKYAIYESDGTQPQYDNLNPFEIIVKQNDEEFLAEDYEWSVKGNIYTSEWESQPNLIERKLLPEINQHYYQPIDRFDGMCVNNAVYCIITQDSVQIAKIHIPVHLLLNRYGHAAINGWDGNTIQLKEDEGIILSPQVGAGHKETDNSFTGVLMGSVKEGEATEVETGLFGYNHGERTIDLNATTGTAKFGKANKGQIVLVPGDNEEDHAYLRSGNFDPENPTEGLEIDLTDPHILFGSGNFMVDRDGNVYATQYATKNMKFGTGSVVGLDDHLDAIDNDIGDVKDSVNYWDVAIPTNAIQIETDTERKPGATATRTLECISTYKGVATRPTSVTFTGNYTGITNVGTSYDTERGVTIISFHFTKDVAIENEINEYEFTFKYNQPNCTPITKLISVNALIKGKDGTSVNIKGDSTNITTLCAEHPSGNTLGDGYILEDNSNPPTGEGESGHLFIFTNGGGTGGSSPIDWRDVGKFKGSDGVNGRGIESIEYTYLTNNSPIKPTVTDNWRSSMETPTANNRYLWQKELITFREPNGSATTQTTILLLAVYGETGKGISSTEVKYQEWTSGDVVPTGTWVNNVPTISAGHYLWTRVTINYTSGSPSVSYSVSYKAINGIDGRSIVVDTTNTSINYATSDQGTDPSSVTGWATTPSPTPGKYLWTRIINSFKFEGTSTGAGSTTSYSVAHIGADGQPGEPGEDGKSVVSITEYYAISTIQPSASSSLWKTTIPLYEDGKSYWKKTVTVWSDSTPDTITIIKDEALTTANSNATAAMIDAANAVDTVNNMEIGGRNYVLKSDEMISLEIPSGNTKYAYKLVSISDILPQLDPSTTEFAISYDAYSDKGGTILQGYLRNSAVDAMKTTPNMGFSTTEWARYSIVKSLEPGHTVAEIETFAVRAQRDTTDGDTVYIKNIKVEVGNKATAWSPAFEDNDTLISNALSAATNAKTAADSAKDIADAAKESLDGLNASIAGLDVITKDLDNSIKENFNNSIESVYLEYCSKSYTFSTITRGSIYSTSQVYYTKKENKYTKVRPVIGADKKLPEDYYIKGEPPTLTGSETWQGTRPPWEDGVATYQRTTVKFYNGTTISSTPFLMEDYQTVDDLRYQDASSVLSAMRGENTIFYNSNGFFCYDKNDENDSSHRIILNNEGILFGVKKNGAWKDTSVWTIDGTFDAQSINVTNLHAEAIIDGVLTLGSAKADGQLKIQDDAGTERMEFNSQRAIYYLTNGGYVIIGKDTGIQVLNANNKIQFGQTLTWTAATGNYQNNINYYSSNGNLMSLISEAELVKNEKIGTAIPSGIYTVQCGDIMESQVQKVNDSINFGEYIKTINVNVNDGSLNHKGVAFISV